MSNYTKTTNFASKDNLSPGNPLKIVKGTEIDTEFNNIATAVATKTDNASANITGGSITGITDLAIADGGTGASTANAALNNLLPSQASASGKYLKSNGTDASWDQLDISTADITGTLPVANGGTGVTSSTGTGSVVLSNSPTLVTPALGTPSSGTATNLTGLPISTGVSGLGTGVATFLGTPSSANLASAVTDETGSGALVFANSPTLVTPTLGTPASATLTNATGLPISTGVSGLGTGVATFLATPSSANLATAVSDETGSGALVFANSPTLVTPALGTPSSATLTNATGLPIATGVSGLGTGVATALAVNVGSSGAPVVNGGALGTPSSGTATNLTGLPLSTGVTGTLPVANGGTGQTTATAAFNALAPSQATNSGKYLTTDGTNTSWATVTSGSGDVVGPASSTDNAFARFDGTTGKLLQNSTGATLSDTGGATFTGSVDVAGTSTAGSNIKLYEDTDNGTNYVSFKAPDTIAANVTWTLPSADGTSSQVLSTNGTGTLSWATVSGGASAATPTALGTVYGSMTTSGASPYLTALGYQAANSNTGTNNVAVGYQAAYTNTSGSAITAVGAAAAYNSSTASGVTAIGFNALTNSTASNNTAVGHHSLRTNTTGTFNVAVGGGEAGVAYGSLGSNTTGANNVAVGVQALLNNTTASNNTAVGYQAGYSNQTGSYLTFLGWKAGYSSTGGPNLAVGYEALYTNTTGQDNVAVGSYRPLFSNTTGSDNIAVGRDALASNTTASYNVAVGRNALNANTTGANNTAVGYTALNSNTTGYNNTAVGYQALYLNTTGYLNTAIGYQAGDNITTGADNVCVGRKAILAAATDNNAVVIGQSSTGKGTNTGYIGVSSGVYQGNNSSSWSTTSDQRLKKNIADNNDGLDKITSIRVRNFEYRIEDEITELPTHCAIKKEGVQLGVIAQELQAVLPECVKEESTGVLSVDTDNLTWYLINAVKQLKAEIDQLKGN